MAFFDPHTRWRFLLPEVGASLAEGYFARELQYCLALVDTGTRSNRCVVSISPRECDGKATRRLPRCLAQRRLPSAPDILLQAGDRNSPFPAYSR
jgi:hypothetical protein